MRFDVDITCPHCGEVHEAATYVSADNVEPTLPREGQVGMCLDCGELYVVQGGGKPCRKAVPDDFADWPEDALADIASLKVARMEMLAEKNGQVV